MNNLDLSVDEAVAATRAATVVGADSNPERTAKVVDLSAKSGAPAQVIDLDPEGWQQRIKTSDASASVAKSPELQAYVASDPMASKVSNDDYENLQKVADSLRLIKSPMWADPPPKKAPPPVLPYDESIAPKALGIGKALQDLGKAFIDGFGDEPLGIQPGSQTEKDLQEYGIFVGPNAGGPIRFANEALLRPVAKMFDAFLRTFAGATSAIGSGAEKVGEAVGMREPKQFGEGIRGLFDYWPMHGAETLHPIGETILDAAALDKTVKALALSKTKVRAPGLVENFIHQQRPNDLVRLPAQAIVDLYANSGKRPEPGDGLLGFVPNIERNVGESIQYGGDVEIPLSTYLTHVDPKVHDELAPSIRSREDGLTINEVKDLAAQSDFGAYFDALLGRKGGYEEPKAAPAEATAEGPFTVAMEYNGEIVTGNTHPEIFDKLSQEKGFIEGNIGRQGFLDKNGRFLTREEAAAAVGKSSEFLSEDVRKETPHGGYDANLGLPIVEAPKALEAGMAPSNIEPAISSSKLTLVAPSTKPFKEGTFRIQDSSGKEVAIASIRFIDRLDGTKIVHDTAIIEAIHSSIDNSGANSIGTVQLRDILTQFRAMYPEVTTIIGDRVTGARATPKDVSIALRPPRPPKQNFLAPLFADAKSAGMTEPEFARYGRRIEEHNAEAVALATQNAERVAKRRLTKEFRDGTARIREEVASRFDERPDILADRLLREGRLEVGSAPAREAYNRLRTAYDEEVRLYNANRKKPSTSPGITAEDLVDRIRKNTGNEKYSGDDLYSDWNTVWQVAPDAITHFASSMAREMISGKVLRNTGKKAKPVPLDKMKSGTTDKLFSFSMKDERPEALGTARGENIKLQKTTVNDILGPKYAIESLTSKTGVHPDELASMLGYRSGEALVRDLEALALDRGSVAPAKYREAQISRETALRADTELGDLQDAVTAEMGMLVQSNALDNLLFDELRVMYRQGAGEDRPIPFNLDELKSRAARIFNDMPVKQANNAKVFARDVNRAGRQAELALLKNDIIGAFKAKQQQLTAKLLAKEALKFESDLPKIETRMERFAKADRVSSMDQGYVDQAHRILERLGVSTARKNAVEQSLRDFVAEKVADGREIPIPDFLFEESQFHKHLDELSTEELRLVDEAMQTLAHNGREERSAVVEGKKVELASLTDAIASGISELPPRFTRTRGAKEGTKSFIYQADAAFTRPEEIFMDLDARDPQGPLMQSVMRPLQVAKHLEEDLFREATTKLKELPEAGDARRLVSDIPFINKLTERPYELTRGDVMTMALNMGSKENRADLAFTLGASEEEVLAFINKTLRKEEWDHVQGMWDFFRWLKPKEDEMIRRVSGVANGTVEAIPVETPFGPRSGGYFPILHDAVLSDINVIREGKIFDRDYGRASTPKTYTRERTGAVKQLQIQNAHVRVGGKVREAIHDIAFREAILQADRILKNKSVRAAINKHYGPEYGDKLEPWLKNVANYFNTQDRALVWYNNLLRGARKNIVIATLGFNLKTFGTPNVSPLLRQNPLDIMASLRHFPSNYKFAHENSGEIRHWLQTRDRDINEAMTSLVGMRSRIDAVRAESARFGMLFAAKFDQLLAVTVWSSEYAKGIRRGLSHDDAVFAADVKIRGAFGTHHPIDLPAILSTNNEGFRLTTIMLGFMNTMYNRQRAIVANTRSGVRLVKSGDLAGASRDFSKVLADTLAYVMVPAVAGALYMGGRNVGANDSWGKWLLRLVGLQIFGEFPLLRDLANFELAHQDVRPSPLTNILLQASRLAHSTAKLDPDGKWLKTAVTTVGYVFGLPTGQAANVSQYLWNVNDGTDHADTWEQFVRGITYGKGKK